MVYMSDVHYLKIIKLNTMLNKHAHYMMNTLANSADRLHQHGHRAQNSCHEHGASDWLRSGELKHNHVDNSTGCEDTEMPKRHLWSRSCHSVQDGCHDECWNVF